MSTKPVKPSKFAQERLHNAAIALLQGMDSRIDAMSSSYPFLEDEHLPSLRTLLGEFRSLMTAANALLPEDEAPVD